MNSKDKKHRLNVRIGEDIFEEIRYKVLYPFDSINEILLYVVLANLVMDLMLLTAVSLSIKQAIGK